MVARVLALLSLFSLAIQASAQTYRFEIPKYVCNLSLQEDASLQIGYEITFACLPGSDPIDIVDIGFPTRDYDPGSIAAELDGVPLTTIRPSEYIPIGVEIPLGDGTIMPGNSAVLKVSGVNPGMAFRDSSDPAYASTEFVPTWFDASCVSGESECVITFVFPQGADSSSVRYHSLPFTDSWISGDGRVVYEWRLTRRMSSAMYIGVSYPGSLISGEILDSRSASYGGKEASTSFFDIAVPVICGLVFPIGVLVFVLFFILRAGRNKLDYLPPTIGVEGTGIKRGLTAPMAAMLLELKLEKVAALILYGLVLKRAVEMDVPPAGGRGGAKPSIRRITPEPEELHGYEKGFLEAIGDGADGAPALDSEKLVQVFIDMLKNLRRSMSGFSLKETRKYYRSIISKAWDTASEAGTPEAVQAVFDDDLQWMMMDPDFDKKMDRLPGTMIFPSGRSYSFGSGSVDGGKHGRTLAQACARVAGSIESAAGNVASSFSTIAAHVTSVTNPPPVDSSSGSGGGSGRSSCACACACAGCACACAGGGR